MKNAKLGKFEQFSASKYRVGIVVAEFNADITTGLLLEALRMLNKYGVSEQNIKIIKVPGSVEIPVVLKALAEKKTGKGKGRGEYDCLIALGAVIRGDTAHFDYVCKMVSEGILRVMMDYNLPVGFGILTVENKKQALARFEIGGWAAEAALQSANIIKKL